MLERRLALGFLGLASPTLLLAFVTGGRWAELAFLVIAAIFPVALITVGITSPRRKAPASEVGTGPLRSVLLALLVILLACFLGMWRWRGGDAPFVLGLPLTAAIQVYGLALLPMPLVALAYALTFDRFGLDEEDLRELGRRFGGDSVPESAHDGGTENAGTKNAGTENGGAQ